MKLTTKQLRKIIKEETSQVFLEEEKSRMVTESLGDLGKKIRSFAQSGRDAIMDIGNFVDSIRAFLEDNEDWIDPLWDMLMDLKNERGDDPDSDSEEVDDITRGYRDNLPRSAQWDSSAQPAMAESKKTRSSKNR
jgi:hypothetical protein